MKSNKEKSLKTLFKASLPIVLFFQLSGCASLFATFCPTPEGFKCEPSHPYAGVTSDVGGVFTNEVPVYVKPLLLIDFPFSLVMDTLLLPITIHFYIESTKSDPKHKEATK